MPNEKNGFRNHLDAQLSRRALLRFGVMGGIVAATSGLLAACGGDDDDDDETPVAPTEGDAGPEPTEVEDEAEPTEADDEAEPTEADDQEDPSGSATSATIVMHALPDTLDVHVIEGYESDVLLVGSVTEGLTQRFASEPGVEPALAERWEATSPTVWRFYLREGVTFHDGTPFNAEAVVWNVEDILRPEVESSLLRVLGTISHAEVVDEFTVDITTTEPDPILPLSASLMHIMSPTFADGSPEERATKIVGTGPYAFVEWVEGQHMKFSRFADYWGEPGTIEEITVVPRGEPSVRTAMLQAGEAQLAALIPPDSMDQVPQVESTTGVETAILRFNTLSHEALKDVRVRQAISHAIDRQALVDALLNGAGTPASQLFAPITIGYADDLEPYAFDPDAAQALLQEAQDDGVPIDTPIMITGRDGRVPHDSEIRSAIVQMLQDVGLNVSETTMESGPFTDLLFIVDPAEGIADCLDSVHGNDVGDAGGTYLPYIHSTGRISVYNNPEIDALIDEANALSDDEREAAWQEVTRRVYEESPILPVYHINNIFGLAENVSYQARIDGRFYMSTLQLDQ